MTGVQTCALPICFPVTIEPSITIVSSLLCGVFVARRLRLEVDNILSRSKDSDKLRESAIDSLCDLTCDDLGTAFNLIPIRIAEIVFQSLLTLLCGFCVQITNSVIYLILKDTLDSS